MLLKEKFDQGIHCSLLHWHFSDYHLANSIGPDWMPQNVASDQGVLSLALSQQFLTLLLLNMLYPVIANSVDPNQLASEEANWSGSALFVVKDVNFYPKLDQAIWLAGN